jgi:hypothetical protein
LLFLWAAYLIGWWCCCGWKVHMNVHAGYLDLWRWQHQPSPGSPNHHNTWILLNICWISYFLVYLSH